MATTLVPDIQAPTTALETLQQFLQTSSTEITRLRRELKTVARARDESEQRYLACKTQLSAVEEALGEEKLARLDAEEALRAEREEREGRMRKEEQALRDERAQLAAKAKAFGESLEQPALRQSGKRSEREWDSDKTDLPATTPHKITPAAQSSEDPPHPKRSKIETPGPAGSSSTEKSRTFRLRPTMTMRDFLRHMGLDLSGLGSPDLAPLGSPVLARLGSPNLSPLGSPNLFTLKFPASPIPVAPSAPSHAVKTPMKRSRESLDRPSLGFPDLSPLRPLDLSPCEFPETLAPLPRREELSAASLPLYRASSSGSLSFSPNLYLHHPLESVDADHTTGRTSQAADRGSASCISSFDPRP
ncbi:hypothetical protein C8R46DRAFT_467911 [Mycena filopes]|nr:hypothetical protein C8R46DRAFT_467911 [Mycena filopes]